MLRTYQRKQLAAEGRLLEDGPHADTHFLEAHEVSAAHPQTPYHAHFVQHVMWQQDRGWAAHFILLPFPLLVLLCLPPLWGQLCHQKTLPWSWLLEDSRGTHESLQVVSVSLVKTWHCMTHLQIHLADTTARARPEVHVAQYPVLDSD